MQNKILLIGESCIDHTLVCDNERVSPEDVSVPVFKVKKQTETFGMLNIVSSTLTDFGNLFDTLTNDPNYIIKSRIYKGEKQIVRIDHDNKVSLNEVQIAWLKRSIDNYDSIVVSDYGKGLLSPEVIDIINSSNNRVYLDPHPNNNVEQYKNLYVVKLNDKELQTFTGLSDLRKGVQLLKGMTGTKHVFVTLGKDGIYHMEEDSHYTSSQVKTVVNTSGAGDVVLASIVSDMEKSFSIEKVLMNSMKRAARHVEGISQIQIEWPTYEP